MRDVVRMPSVIRRESPSKAHPGPINGSSSTDGADGAVKPPLSDHARRNPARTAGVDRVRQTMRIESVIVRCGARHDRM